MPEACRHRRGRAWKKTSFLTPDEKRAAIGYDAAPADIATKFNPNQPRDDHGRNRIDIALATSQRAAKRCLRRCHLPPIKTEGPGAVLPAGAWGGSPARAAPSRAPLSPLRPRQPHASGSRDDLRINSTFPASANPKTPMTHRPDLELKFTSLDLKAINDDGVFEGYAALFNREDLGRDVVVPGAFRDTLNTRGRNVIKMLYQHDPAEPIGVWETLREDGKGLFARGRLMTDVARAREVLSLMRAGALDGLSIGFKAVNARRDPRSGLRKLFKIDLWEISIVTFPMQPDARVSSVKSKRFTGRTPTEREFERWLTQDAGFTRSEARAFLGSGLKGLIAKRDAGMDPGEGVRLSAAIARATRLIQSATHQ